jgi:hypothetical protein
MWLHSYRSYQVINYNNYLIAPSIGLTGFERSLSNIDNASFVRKLPHKLTKKTIFMSLILLWQMMKILSTHG